MTKKKYELNNSYFKNKYPDDPDTILEIVKYEKMNGELPFKYSGDNYVYDAMCERQKRKGVVLQQFLTPDSTAIRMAELALFYIPDDKKVLDACCGTGQITRNLIESGFDSENITAFDLDLEMTEICKLLHPEISTTHSSFEKFPESKWNLIVSNPPYDIKDSTAFLGWLLKSLTKTGTAVLLLPVGFIDKERPKALVEILSKFNVLHRERMKEPFARTGLNAEIAVLEINDQ